ncbi:MAG: Uncharacterized protein, similar to the N-terminal domain of Lon protease, partial [uncultured Friedmanniella sp.]
VPPGIRAVPLHAAAAAGVRGALPGDAVRAGQGRADHLRCGADRARVRGRRRRAPFRGRDDGRHRQDPGRGRRRRAAGPGHRPVRGRDLAGGRPLPARPGADAARAGLGRAAGTAASGDRAARPPHAGPGERVRRDRLATRRRAGGRAGAGAVAAGRHRARHGAGPGAAAAGGLGRGAADHSGRADQGRLTGLGVALAAGL